MRRNAVIDIDELKIVSPCSVPWDSMNGDDKIRFCDECKRNVFNLTTMTKREIEQALLAEIGPRVCISIARTTDGKIITADCLTFRQKMRKAYWHSRAKIAAASSIIAGIIGFGSASDAFAQHASESTTKAESTSSVQTTNAPQLQGGCTIPVEGPPKGQDATLIGSAETKPTPCELDFVLGLPSFESIVRGTSAALIAIALIWFLRCARRNAS